LIACFLIICFPAVRNSLRAGSYRSGGAVVFACFIGGNTESSRRQRGRNGHLPPGLAAIRIAGRAGRTVRILRIRSGGTWRQRCNGKYGAGSDINFAAVVIDDGGAAAGTDHDRVADIGIHGGGDRLKSLALIDGQIAESRLDHGGPRRARGKHGTTN
jgi:hypothetical protein